MSRFQGKVLSLREFVSRSKVLKLYRDILRALRRLDDVGQQQQLREWARSEFEQLKGEKDQECVQMHLTRGRSELKTLEAMLQRTR